MGIFLKSVTWFKPTISVLSNLSSRTNFNCILINNNFSWWASYYYINQTLFCFL